MEDRLAAIDSEMLECASDYPKLAALNKEKEELDACLDQKMERYIELQDMVDSFNS